MKRDTEAKPLRMEMAVSWKRMGLAVVMGSAFMWTLGAGAETAAAAADRPRLSGAFIQIDNDIANWTAERWGRELDAMHAVGMDLIIIQYVGSDRTMYYPSRPGDVSWQGVGSAPPDSVGMAINEAARRDMQVMLGLTLDPSWWKGNFDAAGDLERNKQVVDELWSRYGRSPAFYGWYIPHEIDDLNSRGADRLSNLIRFTAELSGYAKQVSSGKPVAIAPFFGMHMTPDEYEKWWKSYLAGARVDIVMLQDGVGCHRVGLYKDVPSYYAALQRAATANNVELWSVVEVFNQTHGWPVDGGTWAAVPGKIETIAEQLRVEKAYVSRFVAFEFTHYMSPWQGPEQAKLFDEYRKYFEQ